MLDFKTISQPGPDYDLDVQTTTKIETPQSIKATYNRLTENNAAPFIRLESRPKLKTVTVKEQEIQVYHTQAVDSIGCEFTLETKNFPTIANRWMLCTLGYSFTNDAGQLIDVYVMV